MFDKWKGVYRNGIEVVRINFDSKNDEMIITYSTCEEKPPYFIR